MLKSGLLTNIIRGLIAHPQPADAFESALAQLKPYTIYPTVLKEMQRSVSEMSPTLLLSPSLVRPANGRPLKPVWELLEANLRVYTRILDSLPRRLTICDNLRVSSPWFILKIAF